MSYFFVAVIGVAVGLAELVSRYRDAPFSAVLTRGGCIYLIINAIAAVTALFLLDVFGASLLENYVQDQQRETMRVMIAGFGAIVFLRSSFFRIRVDQSDVSIGPAALLDTLFRVADRDVDRSRALQRAKEIPVLLAQIAPNGLRGIASTLSRPDAEPVAG